MKIVIDTNVIASAIFFGGKPRQLIELLVGKELNAYVTPDIVKEYYETAEYLQNKYPEKKVLIPLTQIVSACQLIEGRTVVKYAEILMTISFFHVLLMRNVYIL